MSSAKAMRQQKSREAVAPSDSSSGIRVIHIPKGEFTKNPFRFFSDPPRMPGEKKGDAPKRHDE